MPLQRGIAQALLLALSEAAGIIAGERTIIGGVTIDEVILAWFDSGEISYRNVSLLQGFVSLFQVVSVAYERIRIVTSRNVEFPILVHTI